MIRFREDRGLLLSAGLDTVMLLALIGLALIVNQISMSAFGELAVAVVLIAGITLCTGSLVRRLAERWIVTH